SPPYTWSIASGNLPVGVSLQGPGERLAWTLLPGFQYLAGRALIPGGYTFTVKVTDSASNSATQTFTWVVSPLALSFTSLPISGNPLVYGVAYSQGLLPLGGSGTYTSWTATGLPPGLSINSSTGVISGTPTNTGFFSATITVTDSAGNTLVQGVGLTVASPT